jgi:hypothetical protein
MRLQVPGSESIVNVGTQKQLFIDDYIIETTRWVTPRQTEAARWIQPPAHARPDLDGWNEGTDRIQGDVPGHLLRATAFVRRTIHQPQRFAGNPIMKPEYPWEGESAPWPANIMWDEEDGVWKMWYNGLTVVDVPVRRHYYRFLYATSRDGIDWDRPTLGLVKDPAGNDTNIIYQGKGQYVLKEAGAAPSRRYKMVYSTADGGVQHPMVQHSPDGLRWEPAPGPYDHNRGDENLAILHDPVSHKYVGFCRPVYPRPTLVHRTERSILRMQSNDLIHWSTPTHIIDRDSLDDLDIDFEAMAPMFYENMYLGFLRVSHTAPNFMESWLAHSRDGFHWQRVRTSPFFSPGPAGSWDSKSITVSRAPVRVGDELRVYYTGVDTEENTAVGLATLRLDGFASIESPANDRHPKNNPPTLTTKPLFSPGNRLTVNAYAAGGSIGAELISVDGHVIPGYSAQECDTFTGDSLAHTFTWNGNPDVGACLPARIRFYLERARLYALQLPRA